ncbi:MAG: hypothetical protein U0795_05815 [Pirellulales bacterium]
MVRLFAGFAIAAVAFGVLTSTAQALPPFKNAFEQKYVKDSTNADWQALVKKEGCNICHVKGEKEKNKQNAYGKELNKLIEGDAQARLKEAKANGTDKEETEKLLKELDAAFKKVEEMKSPTGETFGELLKAGKLPVTQ